MPSLFNRPTRFRFIEYEEGRFVITHQTKENCHLALHEQNQTKVSTSFDSGLDPSTPSSEWVPQHPSLESPPLSGKKRVGLLLVGTFVAWLALTLLQLYWEDTVELLPTLPHSSSISIGNHTPSSQFEPSLKGFLATHTQLNATYKEVKTLLQTFQTGTISMETWRQQLQLLEIETAPTLTTYLEQREHWQSTEWKLLSETTIARLQQLVLTLQQLQQESSHSEAAQSFNQLIEIDQSLFELQVMNLKTLLQQHQISYIETEGFLTFNF